MNMKLVDEVTKSQLRSDLPDFKSGDEVKVSVRIIEGNKQRIQNFQGVVIIRRGGGVSETFTVRKMSSGIGVERTFPLHSPNIASIEVLRKGKVRRNKITYIRNRSGKAARIKEIRRSEGSRSLRDYLRCAGSLRRRVCKVCVEQHLTKIL